MKAKKSLGQNFFVNTHLAESIANTVFQTEHDILVEIGPGQGSFTKLFSKTEKDIILVEKDNNLSFELSKAYPKFSVINKDFLDWDYKELQKYKDKKILFFGSLPYNVSKRIIKKIIGSEFFNTNSYFIVQKEVAEKYTAKEPDNNLLALQTKIFCDTKKLFDIKPDSFRPRPKVTSSFIQFSPNKKYVENVEDFIIFLTRCFGQPRKTLSNNLKNFDIRSTPETALLLSKRPQHVSLDEYLSLFNLRNVL